MQWSSRATVLLKAAELLAGKYRHTLNAATMLSMSKTCHQAEIDSACELIDFWRFNPYFMTEVYDDQPLSTQDVLNYMEHRPLEGFVFAMKAQYMDFEAKKGGNQFTATVQQHFRRDLVALQQSPEESGRPDG